MTAHTIYNCSHCDYTTSRRYNYGRHMIMVHGVCEQENSKTQQKDIITQPKETPIWQCQDCGKQLSSRQSLQRHISCCKGKINAHACPHCDQSFSSLPNKYRHMKKCKKEQEQTHESQPTIQNNTTNIQSQVNNNIQVNNNTTYNQTMILNFPESMDTDQFKLAKDHITLQNLEHLFSKRFQPKQGFARYTSAVLERLENRNVYKTSPNTKYNKIWRNGRWEYELDEEVYPLLTYHMTIAAIDDINNHKKELKKGGKINYMEVAKCLDDINTENDENDNYEFALEKLKIAVLNFSERFGLPVCV